MKRLLNVNPLTGRKTWYQSHGDGTFSIIAEGGDADAQMRENHELRKTDLARRGPFAPGGEIGAKLAARVPVSVIHKWLVEDGLDIFNPDHQERYAAKLNDPEWAYLRVWDGRIDGREGGF